MNKRGRPFNTGLHYISLSDLINKFPKNFCIPVSHKFIQKHNLFEENGNTLGDKQESGGLDLKITNFNE